MSTTITPTLPICTDCGGTLTPTEEEHGCEYCKWQAEHDERVENLRKYGAEA